MSKHERLAAPPTGPHTVEELGEGYNPAMWTVTIVGIIAGAVGTAAVVVLSPALGIAAAVLAVLAIVAGVVLTKMGLGSYTNKPGGDSGTGATNPGIQ